MKSEIKRVGGGKAVSFKEQPIRKPPTAKKLPKPKGVKG